MRKLYRATCEETSEQWDYFRNNYNEAEKHAKDNMSGEGIEVKQMFTVEGYEISFLRELPKGDYFQFVREKQGIYTTSKQVWVKDTYDAGTKSWCCYKFDDINDSKLFGVHQKLTVDFTF